MVTGSKKLYQKKEGAEEFRIDKKETDPNLPKRVIALALPWSLQGRNKEGSNHEEASNMNGFHKKKSLNVGLGGTGKERTATRTGLLRGNKSEGGCGLDWRESLQS